MVCVVYMGTSLVVCLPPNNYDKIMLFVVFQMWPLKGGKWGDESPLVGGFTDLLLTG